MTKQEKMLEKEKEKQKKLVMKEKRKQYDGGFAARCVAVLIGFVLGIVGTLGGIVGGGYYIATKKTIKETASLAGGFDITQYLAEEYADKTIAEFVTSIGDIGAKFKGGSASLATVAEISPYANKLADTLVSKLSAFGLDIDAEELKTTAFSAYGEFLQTSLQKTRLAGLIGAKADNTLMGLLCFGEEGVNYIKNEDGSLTWLGDSHELTVGDFMDNGATSDVFNRLSLKAVMESSGSVNLNDSVTRALVYGTKGVDYEVKTATGEGGETVETVSMLPLVYTVESDGAGGITLKDDHGETIDPALYKNDEATGLIILYESAPAEGETPEITAYLKQDSETEKYYAYKTAEDAAADTGRLLHKLTSLGDLMKGNFVQTFESLQLCDLLNVTAESDGAVLALAYGNKGEDYTVTDGNIVMLGGSTPRTVKDLKNDSSLFSNLRLADILKISPSDANETMVSLAYGREGKNYTVDGVTGEAIWLAKEYVEKYVTKAGASVLALFDENGKEVSGAVKTGGEWAWSVGEGEAAKSYVAKTVASSDGASGVAFGTRTFYVYEAIDGVVSDTPVKYAPRTINDLKTLETQELMSGMTLESLLKIDVNSTDAVLTSLAYGKEGVTYTVSTDGTGKKYVSMNAICYAFDDSGWADENGKAIDGALYTDLGGGVYEFLRTEDGVSYYAYATGVSGSGEYALCNVHGDALYYGKRTIGALKSENATEVFNDVELKHVIDEDKTDKINLYLLYGKEGVGYEIDTEGNVVPLTPPHTIGDLRASGENSILSKMRKELTIGDILGNVSDNKILKHLAASSLDTLSTDINNLKITDVFESDIYRVDEVTGEFILDAENKKIMKAEWKYLLSDPDTGATGDYTINDMGSLVENMKGNIRNTSIFNLNLDFSLGISTDNTSFLNTDLGEANLQSLVASSKMTTERKAALSGKKVGDLTIKELFDYIPTILAYIPTP